MMIPCPCCQGEKRLTLHESFDDDSGREYINRPQCTHCMGEGEVPAGALSVDQPLLMTMEPTVPPELRKGELSRAVKRDHLLSIKVAPDDADKILNEIYGSTR